MALINCLARFVNHHHRSSSFSSKTHSHNQQ